MSRAPIVVSDEIDYVIVKDERNPFPMNNVIFRIPALKKIAAYYRQKYGIVIYIADQFSKIDTLSDHFFVLINEARIQFPPLNQIGFVFISNDDPDDSYGHALPMIWQRESNKEHLFFLDTTQKLGNLSLSGAIDFRDALRARIPEIQLWTIQGKRQIDYSSCFTDALVMLKDGLREPSFKALVERKVIKDGDLKIFQAPEKLLKTAQFKSYVTKSSADSTVLIKGYCQTNRESSLHKRPITLADFRATYDFPVNVGGEQKFFGTYTLFKSGHYLRVLYEQEEKEEFEAIYRAKHSF